MTMSFQPTFPIVIPSHWGGGVLGPTLLLLLDGSMHHQATAS